MILTCDNGIAAIDQIAEAKELGMTVVITDHHDIQVDEVSETEIMPSADAIVNPKRKDSKYPFSEICGAMVAYKLIQGECLKAPRSDAGVLAKMLGIPCMALGKNGIWKRQALAGELKNLLYRNTGEFMEGESFYEKITEAGFPLGPVCASLVAFAVIVLSALGGQFYTAGKLERLDRISADQQGNDVTQERRDLEGKISELAKLTAEKRELAGQITLDPAVFSCLEQALLPEMDLETIEYQAEDASIHLKLSTSKPEQVSLFCEKIEENSGFSLQQSHWQQQEDKVSAALVFTIGKGAKDEAQ